MMSSPRAGILIPIAQNEIFGINADFRTDRDRPFTEQSVSLYPEAYVQNLKGVMQL